MGDIIVVSGPPGVGKSSVAAALVQRYEPGALVEGDAFFAFLERGRIDPWLPESDPQNRAVLRAAAATCGRLAEWGTVVYDGVLWPPYADLFADEAGRRFHYAILLPPLEVCLDRVRNRVDHPFTDLDAASSMWRSFAEATTGLPTLTSLGTSTQLADEIAEAVQAGSLLR